MAKNPKANFFWKDYESDDQLKLCGLAAQGLWMRMLCFMARQDEVGFLTLNGSPLSVEQLALVAGRSADEVGALIKELGEMKVYSVDARGAIYCRRLVHAEKFRKESQKNGRKGGSPKLMKSKEEKDGLNRHPNHHSNHRDEQPVPPPIPLNHITTNTTEPSNPSPASPAPTPVSQVCEAMGVRLSDDPYRLGWAKILHEMMRDGLDLHADIIPAAIEARKRSVANLTWVRRAAEAGKAKRGVKASQASAPPAFERTDDRGWTKRCMVWFGLMDEADKPWLWTPKWGPKPDEDGFLAPPEIFAKVAAAARKVRPELFSQETAH